MSFSELLLINRTSEDHTAARSVTRESKKYILTDIASSTTCDSQHVISTSVSASMNKHKHDEVAARGGCEAADDWEWTPYP